MPRSPKRPLHVMLGNFSIERYFPTCLTFWTRGSILINYKVRVWLPREELICDWIKAAQLYIHQQDPDLILTTPTISRTQQCWPSWDEGIGWRGRPLANIGRQRNAASCLAPPQLTPSRSNSSTMALEHSSTIFLCCLVGVWNISDDPFRNQNINNKDHRVG